MAETAELKEFAEKLVNLTVKEAQELSDILKDEYNIEPAAGGGVVMAAGPAEGEGEAAAAEPTEFDLVLEQVGDQKIKVIKAVREVTGLGLKEAKALVDAVPKAILEKKGKDEIDDAKKKLEEAGAVMDVKAVG
jgi:large subunit ribosomal protein L7/L12